MITYCLLCDLHVMYVIVQGPAAHWCQHARSLTAARHAVMESRTRRRLAPVDMVSEQPCPNEHSLTIDEQVMAGSHGMHGSIFIKNCVYHSIRVESFKR